MPRRRFDRRAEFARPAEAYGLHLTGFIEMARGRRGTLESFWFGFRVDEPPPVVVRKIGEIVIRCGLAVSKAGGRNKLPPAADPFQVEQPRREEAKP